jgi:hypothetical protein
VSGLRSPFPRRLADADTKPLASLQQDHDQVSGCGELAEPYAFLLDKILQAPNPEMPTVQPESISPRDLNPDPDARRKWQQQIFIQRAARFKVMYGN